MKKRGFILLTTLVVSAALLVVIISLITYLTSYVSFERYSLARAQALAIAEGGIDEAMYALDQNSSYTGETDTPLGAGTFSTTVTTVNGNTRKVAVTGYVPNRTNPSATRTVSVTASVNTSVISFHYGIQTGNGGISMSNNSQINGGVYAMGNISGSGIITGDATAAGTKTISGVTINGNATAHALSSCTIGKDATFSGATTNCSVGGAKHPNSPDAPTIDFPISDAQIAAWEAIAQAGGIQSGPYTPSGTVKMGPKVINGDLTVTNNATFILTGPVWVKGNVDFSNNAHFLVDASTGNDGAVLIADVPGSTATKGTINLANGVEIAGNGNPGSFPMALSTNTGGSAINLNNNANSIVLYAPYGTISISNGASANQITAKQISMSNNSSLDFVSGLQNAGFSDGPGGSWAVIRGSYAITN